VGRKRITYMKKKKEGPVKVRVNFVLGGPTNGVPPRSKNGTRLPPADEIALKTGNESVRGNGRSSKGKESGQNSEPTFSNVKGKNPCDGRERKRWKRPLRKRKKKKKGPSHPLPVNKKKRVNPQPRRHPRKGGANQGQNCVRTKGRGPRPKAIEEIKGTPLSAESGKGGGIVRQRRKRGRLTDPPRGRKKKPAE